MKKLLLGMFIVFMSFSMVTALGCAKKETPPPKQEQKQEQKTEKPPETSQAEKVVFVSSADKPEACASCHVNENSLNAISKRIAGHPTVDANTVAQCAACHKKQGYPSLDKIIHSKHYRQGSAFVKTFNGSCVNCHKEAQGGEIFIPGLAAAGTKAVTIEVSQVDKSPTGCVGCHKGDYSLPNMIKKVSGHPQVNFEDFNQCYKCHGATAPQLGKVLHDKHLASDTFKKNYGNSCLNCHKPQEDSTVIVKGKK